MNTAIENYSIEIADLAAYAIKTGFNAENGNFDELVKNWIEFGRKRYEAIMRDKDQAIKISKQFLTA